MVYKHPLKPIRLYNPSDRHHGVVVVAGFAVADEEHGAVVEAVRRP